MTLQTTSFTILGAGLMGRLLAVALARQGHAVSIYDNGGPLAEHSAARVAGGMIAPLADMPESVRELYTFNPTKS